LLATGGKQVRKKRHVAVLPDANTSTRTALSRRVQFPPLQFVSESVRTATKPYANRCHISENVQSFGTENYSSMICLQSSYDHEVCFEHTEKELRAETVEDMQVTKQHKITNVEACCGRTDIAASVNASNSDELTTCPPLCLKPSCCKVDDAACCNSLPVGIILDVNDKEHTAAEKSPDLSHKKEDLTVCAENTSGVHFDINTPSCEFEVSYSGEGHQKPAEDAAAETETCQTMSCLANRNCVEPLHVLSFSRLERSLDATEDPVKRVICAAELQENMSELLDKDEEACINACVNGQHSFFLDKHEFFSTLNSLTPLESRSNNTVLVSDTPVSDYDLSYRQRALKAGNIRLRYRAHKS